MASGIPGSRGNSVERPDGCGRSRWPPVCEMITRLISRRGPATIPRDRHLDAEVGPRRVPQRRDAGAQGVLHPPPHLQHRERRRQLKPPRQVEPEVRDVVVAVDQAGHRREAPAVVHAVAGGRPAFRPERPQVRDAAVFDDVCGPAAGAAPVPSISRPAVTTRGGAAVSPDPRPARPAAPGSTVERRARTRARRRPCGRGSAGRAPQTPRSSRRSPRSAAPVTPR